MKKPSRRRVLVTKRLRNTENVLFFGRAGGAIRHRECLFWEGREERRGSPIQLIGRLVDPILRASVACGGSSCFNLEHGKQTEVIWTRAPVEA